MAGPDGPAIFFSPRHCAPSPETFGAQCVIPATASRQARRSHDRDQCQANIGSGDFSRSSTGGLEAAVRGGLLQRNVAKLVTGKPHAPQGHPDVLANVWRRTKRVSSSRRKSRRAAAGSVLHAGHRDRDAEGRAVRPEVVDLDMPAARLTAQRQPVKPGSAPWGR